VDGFVFGETKDVAFVGGAVFFVVETLATKKPLTPPDWAQRLPPILD
jgi:hypothetical protein